MTTWPFILQLVGFIDAIASSLTSHLALQKLRGLRSRGDQQTACYEPGSHNSTERDSARQHFLYEDNQRDDGGPEQTHRPRADEHHHQRPATTQAVEAVLESKTHLACHAWVPVGQEEVHRAAADPQAGCL